MASQSPSWVRGLGTWRRIRAARGGDRGVAGGARSRTELIDTAEMYANGGGGSWWGRQSPGGGMRSFWSARFCRSMPPAGHHRRLRTQSPTTGYRSTGSLPPALAATCPGSHRRGVYGAGPCRQDPALRRQQLRRSRYERAGEYLVEAPLPRTRCSTTRAVAASNGIGCRGVTPDRFPS
jgi:hypothetical protein